MGDVEREKILAIAYQCGYQEILMGVASVKPDSYVRPTNMTDEEYKKIQKNQELNAQAFGDLLIAQLDKSCFQVIWNCKTSEYKKGSAS